MFDTLKLTKALEGTGFDRAQAETIVSGLYEALKEHSGGLASKEDLKILEATLRSEIISAKETTKEAMLSQTRWIIGVMIGAMATLIAVLKFLQP